MNYAPYPVNDSDFYKTGEKNVFKKASQNCFPTQGYIKKVFLTLKWGSTNLCLCPLITGRNYLKDQMKHLQYLLGII